MELPHSRPLGNQAGRKATHDFLSLYSSPVQQDPTPSSQGSFLETHDFLQPLDLVDKNATKKENTVAMTAAEKPLTPPPLPSVEHILPGGIGTYTISYFNQKALKPEGNLFAAQASSTTRKDENSNCSSHTASGFTLWDESAVKQGKTGKENISAEKHVRREAGMHVVGGQWPSLVERQSQSSSSHKHNIGSFSSFSSSQPSSSQKKQSFMDMITSAKNDQEDDEDDEEDEELSVKKENSSHLKGNYPIKVEAKTIDQKPSTPRSKHSATEQRRRSKINDRFQKLREIIPNSDQKRDKASFLLEVIEYIQFLQEKVTKYENSYTMWNHESAKIMQWKNCPVAEDYMDPTRGIIAASVPASVFAENKAVVSPTIPKNGQNLVESDISTSTTFSLRGQQPESTSKAVPAQPPVHPNIFTFARPTIATPPISAKLASDMDKTTSWPVSQLLDNRSFMDDSTGPAEKTKDQEVTIESGTINISSVYSRRLLNTLTQALQSSGVDLSQASISVQIDLGKTGNSDLNSPASTMKENDAETKHDHLSLGNLARSRVTGTADEFDHALKRLRTS